MAKKNNSKFPGLSKSGDIKIRHELYDQDYAHKLNEEDKLLAK